MQPIVTKSIKNKTAVVFISGSAGELDWLLPILNHLLDKNFNIKILFLSRHSLRSVRENSMCNRFINQKNNKIETVFCGGVFFEKIEYFAYISYRIFLKLNLKRIFIIKHLYLIFDSLFKFFFLKKIPKDILQCPAKKHLFFSEFPSLRRPRDLWIKKKFKNSLFFYFPHSPHIYSEDLDKNYQEPPSINFHKNSYLLLGHPKDYSAINDGRELENSSLEKVFVGHPKFSDNWLSGLKKKAKNFQITFNDRRKVNILILSRGYGSYFNRDSHVKLVESTVKTIEHLIPEYSILVKKHPRETSSHWNKLSEHSSSIQIKNDHILELATKADFVISFWGSGSMDCFLLGVPVIEYWDPIKNNKQQVFEKGSYTTIYRKLGIVLSSNSEKDLRNNISKLLDKSFKSDSQRMHAHFNDLISRSNNWDKKFNEILSAHKLIGN